MSNRLIELSSNNEFHLSFPKDNDLINAVKQIPGRRWNPEGRFWTCPTSSWEQVKELTVKQDFTITHEVAEIIERELSMRIKFAFLSSSLTGDFHVEGLKLPLRKYQQVVVHYGVESKRVLIALPCRTGKTPVSLAIVQHLNAYPCLVVCPDVMKYKWKSEVEKWLPDSISCDVNNKSTCCTSDISVINYDNLKKFQGTISQVKWSAVIFDESHRIKSEKSIRGKLALEISKDIPVRIELSATPIVNKPKDLAHQLDVIDRLDVLGGKWHFLQRYCDGFKDTFGWNFDGASNLEELYYKLQNSGSMIQRLKKDILPELPPKTIEVITVDIDNMAQYNHAVREARRVNDNTSALKMISELRQIVARGKLAAIKEQVDDFLESGHKLVLFSHFTHVIDRMYSWHPEITLVIDGRDDAKKKAFKANQFQTDDKIRIVICSDMIGEGIDLSAASYSIHADWVWTHANLEQNTERMYAHDITSPLFCYVIHSDTGLDRMMKKCVERKEAISLSSLQILKFITDAEV